MGINDRLNRLERQMAAPERRVVVFTVIHDVDPPAWAEEAIRPHLPTDGVAFVEWYQATQGSELRAKVDGQWYKVMPDGCPRIEAPFPLSPNPFGLSDYEHGCRLIDAPFTLTLDNPNEAGL